MSQNNHDALPPSPEPYTIFTPAQKVTIVTIVSTAATLSGFASNIYFPSLPQIASDLSVTTNLVNLTVTCYMIFQGLSPTVWGALADAQGRRITYCCTLAIFLAACVGLAETRSYAQLVVLRCVQSTGSASTIALGAGVIGDITKREERGGYMGFFQGGLLTPVAIGPVIGGVLAGKLGWKSVFWFLTIYGAICFGLIALVLPETLRSIVGNGSGEVKGVAKSILGAWQRKRYLAENPRPASQESQANKNRIDFLGPIKILLHLKTFMAILLVAVHYAVWQMVLTALSTLVRAEYQATETQIGLIFMANGVGSIVGTLFVGKLLDWDYRKILRSVNGEEESVPIEKARLRTVWIWSGLEFASVVTFGWTVDKHVHISVPIVSLFVLGWAAICIQNAVSTYIVDIHHGQSASAMASLNLLRCLLGAGGTAIVGPLIDKLHAGWTFTMLSGVMLLVGGVLLIEMIYGFDVRRRFKAGRGDMGKPEEQA